MKSKKKISATKKIFMCLILGMFVGVLFCYYVPSGMIRDDIFVNGIFYIIGNGFLRSMQMLVVPLVLCSLVVGTMSIGDTKSMGKIGLKTITFYILTTAVAISLAIGIGMIINPGKGLDISSIEQSNVVISQSSGIAETILDIIPTNPFKGMVEGNMLQIIVFAMLLGVILAKLGPKASTLQKFFTEANDVMMEMTNIVMKIAPIGVFCLIARTFSGLGLEAFIPLLKYMGCMFLVLGMHCFVVYMLLLKGFTKLSPIVFVKKMFPVMNFAFSTASSNATIPFSIETLQKKLGVSKKVSSFTIPLGATINMDGTAIMQGVAVVFTAQAFGMNLSTGNILTVIATATLASIGTAGAPGVGMITLSMVFASIGLPLEGIALIMGVDRILDMTRTAVNIMGDAVCTTIVCHKEGLLNEKVFYDTKQVAKVEQPIVDEHTLSNLDIAAIVKELES